MRRISGRAVHRPSSGLGGDVIFAADDLTPAELDALPYGMIQLDADGTILRYNAAESRLSGRTAARCVGRNFFVHVAPCTQVAEFYGRVLDGVRGERLDVTFVFLFAFVPPRTVEVRMFWSPATRSVWVRVVPLPLDAPPARPASPASPRER